MSQTTGHVTIRKNAGANVGTQPRLNLTEGANVTLTITQDLVNHEIDVTIASAAGGGTGLDDQFFPAVDPNEVKGLWPSVLMPDGEETTVYQTFNIPANFSSIDTAVALVIPEGTGNFRRSAATDIAACGEDFETHQDTVAEGNVAVTTDEVECIDISAALTPAVGSDFVAISFTRHGDDALDTVNADVYYVGIYIEGTI
jgi:hypothetical protein